MRLANWLHSARSRRLALLLALAVALAVLAQRGFDPYLGGLGSVGSLDFTQYWSAARLTMDGGNPYDSAALLAVERAAGWPHDDAVMMWNPPWTLALVMPVALLPFEVAIFAWLLVQLGLLLISGFVLWRYFAPTSRRPWIGMLLAAGFIPSWLALRMGQISPWLLAGVVGFLWGERKERDLVAGAALALLTVKPHVTYLFLVAALWWVWRSARWRVLTGWLAALGGATGIALLVNRHVLAYYLTAGAKPLLSWATPTLGGWLRLVFGVDRHWLQFLPSVVGGLGLLVWLWRRRGPWRWEVVAGPLLLASVVTGAYGWGFDQVVVLPAVVALVAALPTKPPKESVAIVVVLLASQVGLWAGNYFRVPDAFDVWHAPLLAGLYWWGVRPGQVKVTDESSRR